MDNEGIYFEDLELTLTASELMVGDLVKTNNRVNKVRSITFGGPIICGMTKDPSSWEKFTENEIRPIEITSTILENNGFKEISFERYELKNVDKSLILRFSPLKDPYGMSWVWMIPNYESANNDEYSSIGRVNFVHELQHILRVIGLRTLLF